MILNLKIKVGGARALLAVGITQIANPAFLPVAAGTIGLAVTAGALTKSFSRSIEYQADKNAVEQLGANPLALLQPLERLPLNFIKQQESLNQKTKVP